MPETQPPAGIQPDAAPEGTPLPPEAEPVRGPPAQELDASPLAPVDGEVEVEVEVEGQVDSDADAAPAAAAEATAEPEAEAEGDAAAADGTGLPTAPTVAAPAVPELSPAACGARLAGLFPALFAQRPQPLKLRIQADIQQRAPGTFTRKTLSAFLHRHTTTNAYLTALTQAPQRVDLDGAAAGDIADEHRVAAVQELARRRGLHEERRAGENAARRAAEAQARQAHAAQDQQRRDRAALLRAVETSTLTRANFCALKGLAEADLEAQLVQARAEALQRAQEPRPEPRSDTGVPRRDGPPPHDHREPRRGPRNEAGPRPDARHGPRPARAAGRGEPRR